MLGPNCFDLVLGRELASPGLGERGLEWRFFFCAQGDDRWIVTDQLLEDTRQSVLGFWRWAAQGLNGPFEKFGHWRFIAQLAID